MIRVSHFRDLVSQLWRWSLVVTLPFTLFVGSWLVVTFQNFLDYGVLYDSRPFTPRLYALGQSHLSHLGTRLRINLSTHQPNRLRAVDLFINESDRNQLNERLPYSGREYKPAWLVYPSGEGHQVKLRYRGDFVQHWGPFKKSLRIKTRKRELFEGIRRFNVITPKFLETLNNHLAYHLARQLGVLAPDSEMVQLRINGDYAGVYLMVEQLGESTIRRASRMPGDMYSGDAIGRDQFSGVSNLLIENAGIWEKIAINNHFAETSKAPLEQFLLRLRNPQLQQLDPFNIIDKQAWGTFMAYEVLTQAFHSSNVHNWRLYYDPWRNVMVPITWDPDGWHPQWRKRVLEDSTRMDVLTSKIHSALFADQEIQLARHQAISDFFSSGADRQFLDYAEKLAMETKKALENDAWISWNFRHHPPAKAIREVDQLIDTIRRVFTDVREAYLGKQGQITWDSPDSGTIQLQIEGRRPAKNIELNYSNPPENFPETIYLELPAGNRIHQIDLTGATQVSTNGLTIEAGLLAAFETYPTETGFPFYQDVRLKPGNVTIKISPPPTDSPEEVLVDRGRGYERAQLGTIGDLAYPENLSPPAPSHRPRPIHWNNTVHIEGIRYIKEPLHIAPGTIVELAPGASLIIQGRLLAEGTADNPIRFVGTPDANAPWGTVALRGRNASGSRLSYCEFRDGSGHKENLAEYSAMFSAHDVADLKVDNCLFQDSQVVDDMVHIVYSEAEFSNSRFERSLSDALDIDISHAIVRDCIFVDSGNDAIDLMESEAVVKNTVLTGSGDKGISVGEGSHLLSFNNQISHNAIGVETKDTSISILANTTIRNNDQGLHAYAKNWRYGGGGHVQVVKSIIDDNRKPIEIRNHSLLEIVDTRISESLKNGDKIKLYRAVDHVPGTKARLKSESGDMSIDWGSADFLAPYRSELDIQRRGATDDAR